MDEVGNLYHTLHSHTIRDADNPAQHELVRDSFLAVRTVYADGRKATNHH